MTTLLDRPEIIDPPSRPQPARPERPSPRSFRPDIEGLRAFAVVSVVLYHASLGVRGGFVGVDVFFVISGFLITRQLFGSVGRKGLKALPTFYVRRIKRLLPAATVVVVATVLATRLWAPALQVRSVAIDGLFTTFYGLNYRLAVEGTQYLHQTDTVSPLQHFWSLGVEEQFYLLWPWLIAFCWFVGRRFRKALLGTVLVGVVLLSYHYSITETAHSASWAYFSLGSRAWELALGALVALAAEPLARLPRRLGESLATLGLLAVLGSAFLFSDATSYPGSAAAVPVVGAAAVIAAGCGPRRRIERLLAEPLMQCLGRVSYAWYLWHWPMLILAPDLIGHSLTVLNRVIVVLASLAVAIASFFFVETPFRVAGRRTWTGFGTGLGLAGAIAAAVALVVVVVPPNLVGGGKATTIVHVAAGTPAALQQVEAQIATGLTTVAAPSNLTPEPAHAAQDTPPSSKDGCHADYLVITQGPCVFGDPNGTHTAVLFGDSHMEQWLPAFAAAATAAHWKIVNWTKAACPPAELTVFAPTLNRTYTECNTWRAQTIARIGALKPDLVFMGQSENVASSSVSPSAFAAATVATLDQLHAVTSAKIQFFDDVPIPNYDMPTCVADHLGNVTKCTFAMSKAYTYPARHAALAPAIQKAGFATVPTAQWICTSARCPAVVGNLLVYRNDTHLTATYSAWLAPVVAPLLTVA